MPIYHVIVDWGLWDLHSLFLVAWGQVLVALQRPHNKPSSR